MIFPSSAQLEVMPHRVLSLTSLCIACSVLSACDSSGAAAPDSSEEIAGLKAEIQRLKEENEQLRLAPYTLARDVDMAIRANDEPRATAVFHKLADNFPISAETMEMRKRLDAFIAQRRAQDEQDKRVAALGFKALPVKPVFARDDTSMTLASTAVARRWVFDSYGDNEGWRFLDAEKDRKLLVARLNVSSKRKEPGLFGIAAYVADGGQLRRVGQMRFRFVRWTDYGAFLGTHADYANDFGHAWKIPFTAGVAISDDDLKRRPIYIVATREACNERSFERLGQPPVAYLPTSCASLKPNLTVDDFHDGTLSVLKRID